MFSRSPVDIDRFVQTLCELNETNYFQNFFSKLYDNRVSIEDIFFFDFVKAMQDSAVQRNQKPKCNYRPLWFDKECSDAKKAKYQTLRKFRNSNYTDTDLHEYLATRNYFKNLAMKNKLDFNENQIDSLIRNINDSKTFWGKIKNMSGKKNRKVLCNISQEDWYKHFQTLFATTENIEVPDELEIETLDDEIENLIFSSEITDDEILAAIQQLRAGKSPGPDNPIPEFFKKSIHII